MTIPPTDKLVTILGIGIVHVVDGKITAAWLEFDQVGLLQQLGVILVRGQLAEG